MTFTGALRLVIAVLLLAVAPFDATAGAGSQETNDEAGIDATDFEAGAGTDPDSETLPTPPPGPPISLSALEGRWVGEGRLGVKDNPPEAVKCRATYFLAEDKAGLKQNIRCATAGGAIEVKSEIANNAGVLSGTWAETMHNLSGTLQGEIKPRGFRIVVKGEGLHANMDIVVKSDRQTVEIQFFESTLIGLTLVLTKG